MIVKGASRSGPRQLAVYLMRVERWDTGEPAQLLELQSPWAAAIDEDDRVQTAGQLIEAFRDWQTLVEGTKQGRDGLYHSEISPEAHYAREMTREQWIRCADILAEELGLENQPRALVLHAGKDDRPHLHVVWQRTDIDTMKVISDGYNYVAHERASARMEREFGHEFIAGKHAKRDRKKQKEFPRQKLTQDEDQYQKRTGLSKEERIEEIAELHRAADSGPAFKAALEDAGYILAKGDRGYVVVDHKGGHSVLSRNVGLKKKEIEAFMAGVPLQQLPTIEEAKAVQAERRKAAAKEAKQAQVERQPDPAPAKEKTAEPAPAVEEPGIEASKFLNQESAPQPPELTTAQEDAELEALKKALAGREAAEVQKWAVFNAHEVSQLEYELDRLYATKATDFDTMQQQERDVLKAKHAEQRKGLKGILEAIENRWNPMLGAEKAKERRREVALLKRRQEQERKDYLALLEQNRQLEIENLRERQALRMQSEEFKREEDRERYIREYHEAKRLREQMKAEEEKEELERHDGLRDGPPPPKLGK